MFELTVILKCEDSTYKQKFLCYDEVMLKQDSIELLKYVDEARKLCGFEPQDVKIRISMEIR